MVYDDIEWFANGERADEDTLNRPLKQLVDKIDKTQLNLNKTVTKNLEVTDVVNTTDADGNDGLGTLTIDGSVKVNKHITVEQTATINDNINFNSTIVTKDSDDKEGEGSISLDGSLAISKNLSVTGDISLSKLTVNNESRFKENITVDKDIKTSGNLVTLDSEGTEGAGSILISGAATISKDLTLNSNTLNSVDAEGNVGEGELTLAGNVKITKNLTLKDTIKAINDDNKLTIDNDVVITKSLEVLGDIVKMNSNVIEMSDNIITLNSDLKEDEDPTENGGIEINRGSEKNVQLRWNENEKRWEITTDGTEYNFLLTKKDFHFEYKETDFDVEDGQKEFEIEYIEGQLQVFVEGIKLRGDKFTATNETSVYIDSVEEGDWVNIVTW